MSSRAPRPIGAILAGGAGSRLGGSKAMVALAGRPLISYPLSVLRRAVGEVAVLAKAGTELPDLGSTEVWVEPDEPRHPLTGIVHALSCAGGRSVVVCAADMPLVTVELVQQLLRVPTSAPAVVPVCDGELQPLLALYRRQAATPLAAAAAAVPSGSLRKAVNALAPQLIEVRSAEVFFNVNNAEDLARAEQLLGASRT